MTTICSLVCKRFNSTRTKYYNISELKICKQPNEYSEACNLIILIYSGSLDPTHYGLSFFKLNRLLPDDETLNSMSFNLNRSNLEFDLIERSTSLRRIPDDVQNRSRRASSSAVMMPLADFFTSPDTGSELAHRRGSIPAMPLSEFTSSSDTAADAELSTSDSRKRLASEAYSALAACAPEEHDIVTIGDMLTDEPKSSIEVNLPPLPKKPSRAFSLNNQ